MSQFLSPYTNRREDAWGGDAVRRRRFLIELAYETAKMFEETVPTRESSKRREAFFLDDVEKARSRIRCPLMLTGGFRTLAGMQDALAGGAVDVIGLARPMAVEPDLPKALRCAIFPRDASASSTPDASSQGPADAGWSVHGTQWLVGAWLSQLTCVP